MIPSLKKANWANISDNGEIAILKVDQTLKMKNSDGIGIPLLSYNNFGADIIQFEAGKGVQSHVHTGDHILFVLKGNGILEYDKESYKLYPGLCYLVPGNVRHAIQAIEELILIAVGNNHKPLDSDERMTPAIANDL